MSDSEQSLLSAGMPNKVNYSSTQQSEEVNTDDITHRYQRHAIVTKPCDCCYKCC